MNLTDDELAKLKEAQDTDKWNVCVDEILQKRNGQYPPDWYEKVIASPDIDTSFEIITFKNVDDLVAHLGIK